MKANDIDGGETLSVGSCHSTSLVLGPFPFRDVRRLLPKQEYKAVIQVASSEHCILSTKHDLFETSPLYNREKCQQPMSRLSHTGRQSGLLMPPSSMNSPSMGRRLLLIKAIRTILCLRRACTSWTSYHRTVSQASPNENSKLPHEESEAGYLH